MYESYYENGELRHTCYNKNWLIYIICIITIYLFIYNNKWQK
jgi:hypothetical protein